jgi:hypothetical protein
MEQHLVQRSIARLQAECAPLPLAPQSHSSDSTSTDADAEERVRRLLAPFQRQQAAAAEDGGAGEEQPFVVPPVRVRRYVPLSDEAFAPLLPPAALQQRLRLSRASVDAAMAALHLPVDENGGDHDGGYNGGDGGAEHDTVAVPVQTPLLLHTTPERLRRLHQAAAGSARSSAGQRGGDLAGDVASVVTATPARASMRSLPAAVQAIASPVVALVTQRRRGQKRVSREHEGEQGAPAEEQEAIVVEEQQAAPALVNAGPVWFDIDECIKAKQRAESARMDAEEQAELAAEQAERRARRARSTNVAVQRALRAEEAASQFGVRESARLELVMDVATSKEFAGAGAAAATGGRGRKKTRTSGEGGAPLLQFEGYHSTVRTSLFSPVPGSGSFHAGGGRAGDLDVDLVEEHGVLLRVNGVPGLMLHIETHERALTDAAAAVAADSAFVETKKAAAAKSARGGGGKRRKLLTSAEDSTGFAALVGLFVEDAMDAGSSKPRLLPACSSALGLPEGDQLVSSEKELRTLLRTVTNGAAARAADEALLPADLEFSPTILVA